MKNNRKASELLNLCVTHGTQIGESALLNLFDSLDRDTLIVLRVYSDEETIAIEMEREGEIGSDFWPESEYYILDRADYENYKDNQYEQ